MPAVLRTVAGPAHPDPIQPAYSGAVNLLEPYQVNSVSRCMTPDQNGDGIPELIETTTSAHEIQIRYSMGCDEWSRTEPVFDYSELLTTADACTQADLAGGLGHDDRFIASPSQAEIFLNLGPASCHCPANLDRCGMLDLADINAFAAAFVGHESDSHADLAIPYRVLGLAGITAFVEAFQGCN